jgi:uncharacterized protein (DUF305 family)
MYLFRRTLLGLGLAVFSIVLISAGSPLVAKSGEALFLARSDVAMAKMMAVMKIKPSNDVDRDFVALMLPHHQGAIDMALAELSYGRNEQLLSIAQGITVTQPQEIAAMRLALVNATPSLLARSEEASFLARNDAAMAKMMATMKIKPSNDVDRDFVALMLPHHQGAIAMSQSELIYGHNEPLRNLAQEIIVTQQQEITAMQLALSTASHAPSSSSSATSMQPRSHHLTSVPQEY